MTVFGQADQACWSDGGPQGHRAAGPMLDALIALRRPIANMPEQLVHCDLNPGNLLVAPGLPPALIDVAPFWRPATFALAIFANWIGPRRGDATVLSHFERIPDFDQLLVRAAIRMLLIMTDATGWEVSPERRAAEIVLARLSRS